MSSSHDGSSGPVDAHTGYCAPTKSFRSLRPPLPLPPPDVPLTFPAFALSLLPSPLPAHTALLDAATGEAVPYPAFLSQMRALIGALSSREVLPLGRGDVAFVLAPACLDIPVLYFALLAIGVTVSPANGVPGSYGHALQRDADQGLQQLSRVLTSLGYNEMASAAPLLADAPPLARWPGAITVFAAPDAFLQASCPMCSRTHLLVQHIAMGYYPYAELASAATMKIPSASVGLCLKIATERGPFGVHYARIYADGVEVSHPELYNDGRYVVHGLHGFLRPLTHSCFDAVPRSRSGVGGSGFAS